MKTFRSFAAAKKYARENGLKVEGPHMVQQRNGRGYSGYSVAGEAPAMPRYWRDATLRQKQHWWRWEVSKTLEGYSDDELERVVQLCATDGECLWHAAAIVGDFLGACRCGPCEDNRTSARIIPFRPALDVVP